MASLFRSRPTPQCLSCLRAYASPEIPRLATPFQTQVRGAKKAKLPRTVVVKLQQDIEGYGPQGAVLAVAPGRMRNKWFPKKLAAYVGREEVKRSENLIVERDSSFGMKKESSDSGASDAVSKQQASADIRLLTPARTHALLSTLIPNTLTFHRQPIAAPPSDPSSPSTTSTTTATDPNVPTAIYGSVSVADILARIKETMAQRAADDAETNADAARVVLSTEDVRIVRSETAAAVEGEGEGTGVDVGEGEADRVKVLGEFEVELSVRGEEEPVRRTVRVSAQA